MTQKLIPFEFGYPAVMKVTKAASPLCLAASNAASILPPTPRSMAAREIASAEETPSAALKCLRRFSLFPEKATFPNALGIEKEEKATVEEARQPSHNEKEARRIICNLLDLLPGEK